MRELRAMTDAERQTIDIAGAMQELQSHRAYNFLLAEIHRLKDGAVESVLAGLEPMEYRRKLGFIAALDEVLGIPGELYESSQMIEDNL